MNPDIHEKIDAYLRNTLSADERARFEQAMAADEELATEVAIFQLEQEGQELLLERDLREKMQRWKTEASLHKPTPGKRRLWWLLLGAGLLCVCGLLWYRAQPAPGIVPEKPARQEPARTNDRPAPAEPESVPVAQQESPPDKAGSPLRALALAAYDRPNFSETYRNADTSENTVTQLQRVLEASDGQGPEAVIKAAALVPVGDPNYYLVQEILAHACLETARYERAREIFDRLTAANLGAASEHAEWYGIICLLAQSRAEEARKRLDILLADAQHIRHKDALRLEKKWLKK